MNFKKLQEMKNMDFSHYKKTVNGLDWHWVEEGTGPAIILLHGIPESWRCWQHQIPTLSKQFRVIALDMKGYGQSGKPKGSYAASDVAKETLEFLDSIDVESFHIAGHDWGVVIADNIVSLVPERVEKYIRCCLSLHNYDARNSLHHQWNGLNPEKASELMANADAYVRVWFESSCKKETCPDDAELKEIIKEFSYPGISDVVPLYFSHIRNSKPVDYSKFTMPVLYIHGEHDPRQPIEYARGMEKHIPGLQAILVLDAGHFVTWEKPDDVTDAMMWFLHSMLGSGLPIFERSRFYDLPTKPTYEMEAWGCNPGVL
jgi:pimeloyl-ACP methyl ester carboxylesterase